jgi:Phage integrase family
VPNSWTFHFHDLRHTIAFWAVQRGARLQEVKDLLGHHSWAMRFATATWRLSSDVRQSPGRYTALRPPIQRKPQRMKLPHEVVLLQK